MNFLKVEFSKEELERFIAEKVAFYFQELNASNATQEESRSEDDAYLTPKEVAAKLKICLATLWHWDRKGITKPLRVGNAKRYRKCDIESIFESIGTEKKRR
jgi:hypothetical protein